MCVSDIILYVYINAYLYNYIYIYISLSIVAAGSPRCTPPTGQAAILDAEESAQKLGTIGSLGDWFLRRVQLELYIQRKRICLTQLTADGWDQQPEELSEHHSGCPNLNILQ